MLINCLLLHTIVCGYYCVWALFCCILSSILSSFAIISLGKRELLDLLSNCNVDVSVRCLFLAMRWTGLQCLSVAFPFHTHLLFHMLSAIIPF